MDTKMLRIIGCKLLESSPLLAVIDDSHHTRELPFAIWLAFHHSELFAANVHNLASGIPVRSRSVTPFKCPVTHNLDVFDVRHVREHVIPILALLPFLVVSIDDG